MHASPLTGIGFVLAIWMAIVPFLPEQPSLDLADLK